jgi:PKD repeat protein
MRQPLFRLILGLMVLPVLTVAGPVPTATAAPAPVTGQLVKDTAAANTPQVLDGYVLSIARVGDTMILGGTFSQAREVGSAVTLTRSRLLAFDVNTGKIDTNFTPTTDGAVNVVIPGPNNTVYVGGAFNNIAGVARRRVAQLNLSTGASTSFDAGTVAGDVKDLKRHNNRLFVSGMFTHIAGQAQLGLATVNQTTGKFDPYVRNLFAGTQNGGYTGVIHIDISTQANRLLAIGNFATVDGASRRQVAMLDLNASSAGLSSWQTPFYEAACSSSFNSYMRDLDISPDGAFAVISTTGAYGGSEKPCDTTARFEMGATGTGQAPSWVDFTGGDTTYAVEITDSVVYTGGHARWQNNPNAGDRAGAGAVARPGIAALDPDNGLPLSWNPTRERGIGVFDFRYDEKGLWVASDTERIGPMNAYHPRIALLPVGGTTFVKPVASDLPNDIYSLQGGQNLVRRYSNGSTFGSVTDAPDVTKGTATLKGAFMLNGDLFTAWSDQGFVRQSFNGTAYGAQTPVNTHNQLTALTQWNTDLAAATSMTYQRGRVYYTLPADNNLYYRYFTPENNVIGAKRYIASASVAGLSFSTVRGMFLSAGSLFTTDAAGNLRKTTWNDGPGNSGKPVASTTSNVSGPATGDNRTWTGPLFLFQNAQGQPAGGPPQAAFTETCTSRACDFDGSTSTGDVSGYAWDFGDGHSGTGANPSHDYAADGTYTVTLTVTSSTGTTSVASHPVTVERVNAEPTVTLTNTCTELTCHFDASGSTDPDGTITGWSWTFGDGGTSTAGSVVDHTYDAAGTYTVTVTATDNDGGTTTQTKSIDVSNARIDFVGAASSNGNRNTAAVTVPAAVQPGDLMVLSFTINNSPAVVTPPAGWAQERLIDQRDTKAILWTRTAEAGDAGSSVSVATSAISKSDLAVVAYRSTTGAAKVVSSAISFDANSTVNHVSPTVAGATDDTWLLTYFARESSSTAAWKPVDGQTVRSSNLGTGGGNVAAILVDSNGPVAAGPRGALTGTLTAASGNVASWSMRVGPN